MKAYICVYRHIIPNQAEFNKTKDAAFSEVSLTESLTKFLQEYDQDTCFFDWGDDPAFFAAEEFIGDIRKASWGVCRRDVRKNLDCGDMVIFFCGKENRKVEKKGTWDYYFIGLGTVMATIYDRRQLWQDDQYKMYRSFYNLLVCRDDQGDLVHKEVFQPYHGDWQKRCEAPYILFEPDDEKTHFNLLNPLRAATYDMTFPEKWLSSTNPFVDKLEKLLFNERGINRRLRTSKTGYQHVFINLKDSDENLQKLRKDLLDLLLDVRNEHSDQG